MSKNFELNVNVRNIPEECFAVVTERVKLAVIATLQEYGAGEIKEIKVEAGVKPKIQ